MGIEDLNEIYPTTETPAEIINDESLPDGFYASVPEFAEVSIVITRADGTVEDLGVVSASYKSRWKQIKWKLFGERRAARKTRKANEKTLIYRLILLPTLLMLKWSMGKARFPYKGGNRSPITDEQFAHALAEAEVWPDVAEVLNYSSRSSNTIFRKRAERLGLDYSHIRICPRGRKPFDQVFTKDLDTGWQASIDTRTLKRRMLKLGIPNMCGLCGLDTSWNGRSIVLQLDHINGNTRDNRLENLRILCPNCHSQTPTYGGKNNKKEILSPQS